MAEPNSNERIASSQITRSSLHYIKLQFGASGASIRPAPPNPSKAAWSFECDPAMVAMNPKADIRLQRNNGRFGPIPAAGIRNKSSKPCPLPDHGA